MPNNLKLGARVMPIARPLGSKTEELRLRTAAIECAANAILSTDPDGKILWVNPAFSRLTGYAAEEAVGQYPRVLKSGVHDADFYRQLWETIRAGKVWRGEITNRRKDGSLYSEEMTITPVLNKAGEIAQYIAIKQDITDRKTAEQQLHQLNADLARSQVELLEVYDNLKRANEQLKAAQAQLIQAAKMESVGRMAAGIAHEVKNPLSIMLMGVAYLSENLASDDASVKVILGEMRDAVNRADHIIREMLDLSAPAGLELTEEDLTAVVERALDLVRHEMLRYKICASVHRANRPPPVWIERVKIEQVFVNIFINAIHAMPGGGQLTVWIGADEATATVTIENTGPHIPESNLTKIFEPFFTTKPAGIGSGLGLAMAKNILEQHRGRITINNQPGGGVCAAVTLKLGKG